jgi:hypothetical protein
VQFSLQAESRSHVLEGKLADYFLENARPCGEVAGDLGPQSDYKWEVVLESEEQCDQGTIF